jgi:hypothetical protein
VKALGQSAGEITGAGANNAHQGAIFALAFCTIFKSQLLFTHQQTTDLREQIGIRNGCDTPF